MKKDYYLLRYNGCRYGKNILFPKGEIQILKNQVTLILGENGCGKSTLIRKLFYNYSSVSSMVEQENDEIFCELTMKENMSMLQGDNIDCIIEKELEKYSLSSILNKEPSKLSGGEKRVVSILRGIWSGRDIVFMDEPTNDLDYRIVDIIIRIIREHCKNITFIIVTHDERLYDLANCIYEIKDNAVKCVNSREQMAKDDSMQCVNELLIADNNNQKVNSNLISKIFKRDYLFLYFVALITALTGVFYAVYVKKTDVKIDRIENGVVEICNTIYTSPAKLIANGYLPTNSLYGVLGGDTSGISEYQTNGGYNLGLMLDSTDVYDITVNVVFDLNNSVIYYMDEATEQYLKEQGLETHNISISAYLKDISFDDFVRREEIKELFEGEYFVRSNKTISIVEAALKLSYAQEIVRNWIVIVGIIFIMILCYIYVYLKVIRKKVRILYNYGIDKKRIIEELKNRSICKMHIMLMILLGALVMLGEVTMLKRLEADIWLLVMPLAYIVVIASISYIYYARIRKCVDNINKIEGEF